MTTSDEPTTESVLAAMLKQNTGMAGTAGGYFRPMWLANAGRDFDAEPPGRIRYDNRELLVTLNTYQWLKERLHFEPRMDRIFQGFARRHPNDSWLELSRNFPRWLGQRCPKLQVSGIYGDGEPVTIYTYNEDNCLDQDIQFTYFETRVDREAYVVLQSHNGADARDGMSRAHVFSVLEELAIFDYRRAYIVCDYDQREQLARERLDHPMLPGFQNPPWPDRHEWRTEDGGYQWSEETYPRDYAEPYGIDLRKIPIVFAKDHPDYDEKKDQRDEPRIVVGADGVGSCPRCRCSLAVFS